ncbi:hypothetical protein OG264_18770 [Streptomyces xanthophaeus]|uniref:hypothetical protein n=1 Tax=Streptomyces xanthophaeus TaxID=67385 RepID=UPI00386B6CE6|nr:hypothetical protein OG264_18770 [Streptomyces xanthophaeus]WST61661.1 hypothetical protein OG605_19665 [Streptomyces xanthophaeus]
MSRGGAVPGAGAPRPGPGGDHLSGALGDWRRDGLLLCLLPVLCWPAVVAAVLTRPVLLVVLLSPVVLGVRELYAVRRVRRALRDPAVHWTAYEAEVVRRGALAPVLVLDGGPELTLGPLGRRALPRRPWPPGAPAELRAGVVEIALAGDPATGAALWAPAAGRLGLARPLRGRALRRSRAERARSLS